MELIESSDDDGGVGEGEEDIDRGHRPTDRCINRRRCRVVSSISLFCRDAAIRARACAATAITPAGVEAREILNW